MGKVAAIAFIVSSLSIVSQLGWIGMKGNIAVSVIALVWSIVQLSFDVRVFLTSPYELRVKLYDLFLSSCLGGLYEARKTTWSHTWLRCFSNPFTADYHVYDKWFYLLLIKKDAPDHRPWLNETRLYVHTPRDNIKPLLSEEVDTHIDVFDAINYTDHDWKNVTHCLYHLWELHDFAAANPSKRHAMKRYFTVKDKLVRVVVHTDWINTFRYEVSISLLHSVAPLVSYEGYCHDLQCVIYLYTAWQWFSQEPGCGVIDATRGGVSRGSKFIYTAQLAYLHEALSSGAYELRVCQHEDHGFFVA